MKDILIVFDIDGTLTQTTQIDDHCFEQTFLELYQISLENNDWSKYPHVTDWGLSNSIINEHLGYFPTRQDIGIIKEYFLQLNIQFFEKNNKAIQEVKGANQFLQYLIKNKYPIALATGAWKELAEYKLNTSNIHYKNIPFATSNDHFSRKNILEIAIQKSNHFYNKTFQKMIYFGDGKWDAITCETLNIPLIGIDVQKNDKLKKIGVPYIFNDYSNIENILKIIQLYEKDTR